MPVVPAHKVVDIANGWNGNMQSVRSFLCMYYTLFYIQIRQVFNFYELLVIQNNYFYGIVIDNLKQIIF
jgi:hypothetical protein